MSEPNGFGEPEVLWSEGTRQFVWLGAGDPAAEDGMPSHQYLIVDDGEGIVLDPGGHQIFERVHRNVARFVDPANVTGLFVSHQDPDVAAGIDLWVQRHPGVRVLMSGLWVRFLLHLPMREIPELFVLRDGGDEIRLRSGAQLLFIPAHFLHSPGNFHLYDTRSRILFTGDLGAAVVPSERTAPRVRDFADHTQTMEDFHRRYMACNKAIELYLKRLDALKLPIDMVCPQHGAIIEGDDVKKFFAWLRTLDVGVDDPALLRG